MGLKEQAAYWKGAADGAETKSAALTAFGVYAGLSMAAQENAAERRIVYCANGHRCTVPADAYSDGVAASHSCPVCGLGVPKEKTGDQHHGLRRVNPDSAPFRTVTIVLPSGYATAEEFAKDCGFELAVEKSA